MNFSDCGLKNIKIKIKELNATLAEIFVRLDNFGDNIKERIGYYTTVAAYLGIYTFV